MKKVKFGLIPRLIIAIILGIIVGKYCPSWFVGIFVTVSKIFGSFLSFIIPLMIIGFVTKGIADLGEGAGKLLGVTVLLSYASTLVGGSLSYLMSKSIFPSFLTENLVKNIQNSQGKELEPFFSVPISPFFDVTSAIIFAFVMGIAISSLRKRKLGDYTYNLVSEFNQIITDVLAKAIVPFLPIFIFGNFANMSYSGSVYAVLSVFWRIFICIIILHWIYICFLFFVSGSYAKKNPITLIKNQFRGYMTAVGTQSSVATIPVNLECADSNGVNREISEFVVPLGATVHMPGSMITLTACTFTILTMYNMDHNYLLLLKFIAVLGIAMVAAPGAPGGAVMSALPFLPIVGIDSTSQMATLLISLYLTQDSFGTAANISGDNAIAVLVEKIYFKYINPKKQRV